MSTAKVRARWREDDKKPTETVTWPGGCVVVVGSGKAMARWM